MTPRRKIATFLVLTFVFSALAYLPILNAGTMEAQGGLFTLLLMWSPGLAALLTQFIAQRNLRGLGWRPGAARWLGLAYLLPLMYALPVYGIVWLAGLAVFPAPEFMPRLLEQMPALPPALAMVVYLLSNATLGLGLSLVSALGEEIGWRGLLVPELSRLTSFRRVALISGAIWAVWHMPAIFVADYSSGAPPSWYAALFFTIMVLGISFPFAWLTLKSGSLWPAAVLHASHNLFIQVIFDPLTGEAGYTAYLTGEFGLGLALAGLVTAWVFWRRRHALPLPAEPTASVH
jgi:uncharacterized protein